MNNNNIIYYALGFLISFACIICGCVLYRKKKKENPVLTPYEKWMATYENNNSINSRNPDTYLNHSTHSPFNKIRSQEGNLSKPPPPPPPRKSFIIESKRQSPVRRYSTRQNSMRRRSSNSSNNDDEYSIYDIYNNDNNNNNYNNYMNNPLHE